jgi:hypothetical protein
MARPAVLGAFSFLKEQDDLASYSRLCGSVVTGKVFVNLEMLGVAATPATTSVLSSIDLPPVSGWFQPYNISGGSVSDVLPDAPYHGTVIAVKVVQAQTSPVGSSSSAGSLNSLSIATQGADTFSDGVSTSAVLYGLGQAKRWQYAAGSKRWYSIAEAGGFSPWCCVGPITDITQAPTIGYCVDALGVVRLRGIGNATGGGGSHFTLFTLPAGLRPSQAAGVCQLLTSTVASLPRRSQPPFFARPLAARRT